MVVFIAATVVWVVVFSGTITIGKSQSTGSLGTVVLWGTVPSADLTKPLNDFNIANPTFVVKYEQKSADTFDQDLLEALASGSGPDLLLFPYNLAFYSADTIFTTPYTRYPLVSFINVFAGPCEVLLTE